MGVGWSRMKRYHDARFRNHAERLAIFGAGEGGRTLDFDLGKVALYH